MSLQTELDRIEGAKADIAAAIEEKGVSVPSSTKIDGMAALIASITTGSGSGGDSGGSSGTIETCTVEVVAECCEVSVFYTTFENGAISNGKVDLEYDAATINVVKGTRIIIADDGYYNGTCDGDILSEGLLKAFASMGGGMNILGWIANGDGTITDA